MAITKGTEVTQDFGTGQAGPITSVVSTSAGDLLVAVIYDLVNSGGSFGITFDGDALTKASEGSSASPNSRITVFYLQNCSAKADKNLVFTKTGGTGGMTACTSCTFSGVATSSALVTYGSTTSDMFKPYTPATSGNLLIVTSSCTNAYTYGWPWVKKASTTALTNASGDNFGWGYQITSDTAARDVGWEKGLGTSPFCLINEFLIASGISTSIKTVNGLAKASVKTVDDLAIASVKSINGLT